MQSEKYPCLDFLMKEVAEAWKKNFETDGKSGYKPKADKLKVLAEYFHKPIEYFLE